MRAWRLSSWLAALWLPAALVAIWWSVSEVRNSLYFPSLRTILHTLWAEMVHGNLVHHLLVSSGNLALGLLIATVAAVAVGFVLGSFERLLTAFDPVVQFGRSLPQVALIPTVIALLGIGVTAKIYIIAFSCFWPILLNTIDGVRGIDQNLRDAARAYRIGGLPYLTKMLLPAAAPQIAAGFRVALAIGVIVMVFSELYGATQGIGYYILNAGSRFRVAEMWAATILVGIVGYTLSTLAVLAERRLLAWHFATSANGENGTDR